MNDYEWLLRDQFRREDLAKKADEQRRIQAAKRFRKRIRRRKESYK